MENKKPDYYIAATYIVKQNNKMVLITQSRNAAKMVYDNMIQPKQLIIMADTQILRAIGKF